MLADTNLLSPVTDLSAHPDHPPVRLNDDYLYSTMVHPPRRRRSTTNASHVHRAYGPQSGPPAPLGAIIDAGA